MRPHLLITPLKWLLTLGLLGGLFFALFRIHALMREEDEPRNNDDHARKNANGIVKIEKDEAERYGLQTQPARALRWYQRQTVHGRVVPNPQATTEIRSPFAGTLRTAANASWPVPGRWLRAGQTIGWVDIRVGPDVRLDLQNKLVDARSKERGAEEEIKIQQDRVNSLKAATARELIARSELDTALVQLAQAQTQRATARAAAELWEKAIQEVEHHKGGEHSLWSQRLTVPCDGEVTDLALRPGTAVESGAVVLQMVDFRHPLMRLDFPPELLARDGPPKRLEVSLSSATHPVPNGIVKAARAGVSPPIQVQLVGPAPRVDAATQFVSYLYDAHHEAASPANEKDVRVGLWRPGIQVTAQVPEEGAPAQEAVALPAASVLYHEGRPLVYVRVTTETYQRREVRLLGREGDHWVVAVRQGSLPVGVAPEEAVVSRRAQVLLSLEFLVAAADKD